MKKLLILSFVCQLFAFSGSIDQRDEKELYLAGCPCRDRNKNNPDKNKNSNDSRNLHDRLA